MLSKIAQWVRKHVPFYHNIEKKVWDLPDTSGAVVTAIGHSTLTAAPGIPLLLVHPLLSAVVSGFVAVLYFKRENRSLEGNGLTAPAYDHLSDVAGPALVFGIYLGLSIAAL